MTEWLSDAALAKQRLAIEKQLRGEALDWGDLAGIWEPRTQPTDKERCACCGSDGRDEAGGEESHGKRWCSVCIGRGHDE